MDLTDAITLIEPAMTELPNQLWLDLGAGTGTFTAALAELLPSGSVVIAVDRDASAVRALRRLAARSSGADIRVASGDIRALDEVVSLQLASADGALFANVLHFVAQPEIILARIRKYLKSDGRIVVVEYDRRGASRWVPHPLPLTALGPVAEKAGLSPPIEIGRRASRYQGELYSALLKA